MVQLGFSTAIPGITKQTQVVTESNKPIPTKQKPPFPSNKPQLASTNIVGIVKPTREDERLVMQAVAELTDSQLSGKGADIILEKYSDKLSTDSFNDVMNISLDLMNGSGKNEMQIAYKQKNFNPEMIGLVYDIFSDTKLLSGEGQILEDEIVKKSNTIKDIGEGLVSYAGGIPKIIASTGLLNKPADWLVENIANPIREKMGKEKLKKGEYQEFSDYASGSQVGGDENSNTAKTIEGTMSALETLTGVPLLIKGASKIIAKRGLKKVAKAAKSIKVGEDVIQNKGLRKLWNYIQPKETSTTISDTGSRVIKGKGGNAIAGRTEATLFKKPQVIPNKQNIHKLQTAVEYGIDASKSFESQASKAAQGIQQLSTKIENSIKRGNRLYNKKQLLSKLNNIAKAPSDITPKNKKLIQDIFIDYTNKNKGNMLGLHKSRMDFYKDNRILQILKGANTDMKNYVEEVAKASKEFIGESVPKYKQLVRQEAELYDIIKNISTKMVNQSKISKFYKKNKELLKIGGLLLAGAAGSRAIDALRPQ